MQVYSTKGVMIMYRLAYFAIMLILLNGYCCGAAVLVERNTTFRCDGRLDECLIEDDLEWDFLMNPYVSRVLAGDGSHPSNAANNRNKSVFETCGAKNDSPAYKTCVDKYGKENKHICQPKNSYDCRGR